MNRHILYSEYMFTVCTGVEYSYSGVGACSTQRTGGISLLAGNIIFAATQRLLRRLPLGL